MIIAMESALVITAIGFGLFRSRKSSDPKFNQGITSRALASCAVVLHSSVILLPLCNAGSDTIWFIKNPALLYVGIVFLWPNLIAFIIALELGRNPSIDAKPWFSRVWVGRLLPAVSILWTVLLVILAIGYFDVKMPLSGFVLGTVALWLTVIARTMALRLPSAESTQAAR